MFINSDIIKSTNREKAKYFKQLKEEETLLYNEISNQIEHAYTRIKNAIVEEKETSIDKEVRSSLLNMAEFVYTAVVKSNDIVIETRYPTINNTTVKSYDTADSVISKLNDESNDVDSSMESIINEENKND